MLAGGDLGESGVSARDRTLARRHGRTLAGWVEARRQMATPEPRCVLESRLVNLTMTKRSDSWSVNKVERLAVKVNRGPWVKVTVSDRAGVVG